MTIQIQERKKRIALYLLIVAFVILATAGVAVVGYIYFHSYEQTYRTQVERQLSAVAELKVTELAHYRRDMLGNGLIMYQNPVFSGLVRRFFAQPDDARARELLESWLHRIQISYRYECLSLLDTRGVPRLSVPANMPPVASVISRQCSEALRSGRITVVDFYRNEHDQRIYLGVLVPILDSQSSRSPIGILCMMIDPEQYLYPFVHWWPTESRTAETQLVRREGESALVLNNLRFRKNTALNLHIPLDQEEKTAVKAVLGQKGIVEGRDYHESPVIAAVSPVPDSPWFLVARMDRDEVYAPVRERLWLTVIVAAVLLLAVTASIGLLWRQQSTRYYREQYRAAEQLRLLSSRLLTAHEEERRRIAGDIHDTLGASLGAIKFQVERVLHEIGEKAPLEVRTSLQAITPVVQESIEECRRIQMDLRPSLLDDLGIVAALSWLCRWFQAIYTTIHIDQHLSIGEENVPESLKIVLFRITQEALSNIAKHSEAERVYLSLRSIDSRIELLIQDNGRGFDLKEALAAEATKRGMGLSSMRERAELSEGSFFLESLPGKGTTIRASWPR